MAVRTDGDRSASSAETEPRNPLQTKIRFRKKADFISKMHIALKEAAETEYWLKLLISSDYITADTAKGNSAAMNHI